MKRALILLIAIVMVVSCRKKSTDHTKTYFCVKIDSVHSNIPALSNPRFKVVSGYYTHYSDWQINMLIKETNLDTDTLFNRNDTLQVGYWKMTCEAQE